MKNILYCLPHPFISLILMWLCTTAFVFTSNYYFIAGFGLFGTMAMVRAWVDY